MPKNQLLEFKMDLKNEQYEITVLRKLKLRGYKQQVKILLNAILRLAGGDKQKALIQIEKELDGDRS